MVWDGGGQVTWLLLQLPSPSLALWPLYKEGPGT